MNDDKALIFANFLVFVVLFLGFQTTSLFVKALIFALIFYRVIMKYAQTVVTQPPHSSKFLHVHLTLTFP